MDLPFIIHNLASKALKAQQLTQSAATPDQISHLDICSLYSI